MTVEDEQGLEFEGRSEDRDSNEELEDILYST